MIKRIKKFLATLSLSVMFIMPAMPLAAVHAQCLDSGGSTIADCLDTGANQTDPNANSGSATDRVNSTIRLVINVFSFVVGVISVIMIIIGGLKYITSGGESSNITGAKNTILYAIIGLVVVALAQVIVKFVLEKATGTV